MDDKPIENNPVSTSPIAGNSAPSAPPVESPPSPPAGMAPLPPSGPSTVVVPAKKSRLPVWFYILFAVVLVIFLSVTFLLVRTMLEKRSGNSGAPEVIVTVSPQAQIIAASPTSVPTPVDQYEKQLGIVSDSDETSDIEADLNATDSAMLQDDFNELDKQFGGAD